MNAESFTPLFTNYLATFAWKILWLLSLPFEKFHSTVIEEKVTYIYRKKSHVEEKT